MQPRLWRTTAFRLTLTYGALFAACMIALLALVYWRTSTFMSGQIDQLLQEEIQSLAAEPPDRLPERIREDLSRNALSLNHFGLFSSDGVWIVGDIRKFPEELLPDRPAQDLVRSGFERGVRGQAVRLPDGEILVVARTARQRQEIHDVIISASIWSGGLIILVGLATGFAVSIRPLRRVREMQLASEAIIAGDLTARLPVSPRQDEIDLLAAIVNRMMGEVERLISEIKSVGDSVSHDLRTPVTRLRALIYRLQQTGGLAPEQEAMVEQALADTDAILGRFRALLRIAEIDHRRRREGFAPVALAPVVRGIVEIYQPLAEDVGLILDTDIAETAPIEADADLLAEAFSNLLDNAIKFTPAPGRIEVKLSVQPQGPRLEVTDSGPGVPENERAAIVGRFYRSERDRLRPGSGLGLSIVSAVTRLHDFKLTFKDAKPGLRVVLDCWPVEAA